jgi:hypothetical protein
MTSNILYKTRYKINEVLGNTYDNDLLMCEKMQKKKIDQFYEQESINAEHFN